MYPILPHLQVCHFADPTDQEGSTKPGLLLKAFKATHPPKPRLRRTHPEAGCALSAPLDRGDGKHHGIRLALVLLCFAVLPLRAEDDGLQVWTMQSVSQRLDYGLEAMIEAEQHYATENDQTFLGSEITPQMVWHYSPRYDLGIGYERMDEWDMHGMHSSSDEGLVFATVLLPLRDWKFSSRQRFQFGVEEDEMGMEETTGTFRHRFQVVYEGERLPFHLMPFVANEWYFDLLDGEFTENRFWGGLRYRINKSAEAEVFGMRVDDFTHPHDLTTPVVGVSLSLKF